MRRKDNIRIKTDAEISILREAGHLLAGIISDLKSSLKIGMTTREIDQKADTLMKHYGVRSAFRGYRGFPAAACISVNEGVVHGVGNSRVIVAGDIVKLDLGIIHKDFYSDTAVTVAVGVVDVQKQKLMDVAKASLEKGIAAAKPGSHLTDICYSVQSYVELHGFSVVRDFVGHGIGRQLHEEPEIPNYGKPGDGPILKPGMVLAIEPMVNMGTHRTRVLSDGWTVVTEDGKPSAHFEHCVLVTEKGPEILTQ